MIDPDNILLTPVIRAAAPAAWTPLSNLVQMREPCWRGGLGTFGGLKKVNPLLVTGHMSLRAVSPS